MIALERSPSGLARTAFEALEEFANPKAAHRRRKADRHLALAKGRKALIRLKSTPHDQKVRAPHLAAAIAAIETLEAAVLSLDAIAHKLADAQELLDAADAPAAGETGGQADEENGTRALLAERYDELRDDITRIASTAYAGRTNLLDGLGGQLEVPLDGSGRAKAIIPGVNASVSTADNPNGIDLPPPEMAFATAEERETIARALSTAIQQTSTFAARFEVDAALMAARVQPPKR
ncbi:MAG: hypothetical protein AAFY01_06895 [Pseudomonadota bacterium]